MILFDVIVWLAVAKAVVLLLEDGAYAIRGQESPRRRERARRLAEQARKESSDRGNNPTAPAGSLSRTGTAIGGYFAGLVEDATSRARANRRIATARRRGAQSVDGVFVDAAEGGDGFYADCDVCGWSSRLYRIENNALAAGREHTHTVHPDQYSGETKEASQETHEPNTIKEESTPSRPDLRLVHGGADEEPPATPTPAAAVTSTNPGITAGVNTNLIKEFATVNIEATGPEEIAAAFASAAEAAGTSAEEAGAVSAALTEVAERFETLNMAGSTIELVREAAEQYNAAMAALNSAQEQLQAAMADFTAKDGRVAEAVADAGNLANQEILVG